ncbi:Ectoine-binding periplasmic protein TeaA [wastewater metagenome]|uniref:Ectoine-binding periplasmic protein TeaA n=2 Tax=unclassified sequences TaxID=12908 RepID=A0A5B8RC44_9ZZZZ|nr:MULTISPECIES: TRAP transporter substrate-binding protein DctP [Arhodomonas]MCS4504573.1 TRAP transporter substrate-binding protein DctP [Arhodomonas aquaeolei]QEA05468.1 ectoine-binding periplasmic protein TeaA [uncultured organism]
MRLYKSISIAALGLGLAFAATASSAETWRFGLEEIEGSVQYEYAAEFKNIIEEKTDGDVTVELYPYGELGGLTDIYDAVQSGAIQLAFGSGFLGGTVPESQLFSLNFILPQDEWMTTKVLNSPEFLESDPWQNAFQDRGLHPIAIVPEGFQVWTANKPIHTPDDMEGLAIRVMDNRLLLETYRAYGASPTTIEYGELYSALQQGQAEGNIQPVFAHEEMNFYEVQDYMIFANQAQFVATAMANQDWYSGLSDERKQLIKEATDELVRYIHDKQQELNSKRLDIIKSNSDIEIIRLSDEERNQFRELAKPVRQVFVDEVGDSGQELLDLVTKLFDEAEKK